MILNMHNLTVLAEPEASEMPETTELQEETEEPEAPTMSENALTVSENTLTANENSVTDIVPANKMRTASRLENSVLQKHIVRGQNPEGAVVNLFDYRDMTFGFSGEAYFARLFCGGWSVDGFSKNTFADNTKHILQMFYLGRGHMASNLSLRFNVVVVEDQKSDDPDGNDPGDDSEEPPSETEDSEETLGTHSDTKTASAEHSTGTEQMRNAIGSPQTGDDSLIGWWAVLSLVSLLGIGATVYNMVLVKGREKKPP